MKIKQFLIILAISSLIILTFLSCSKVKPGASAKSGGLYESFYLGPDQNQYFIKPLEFEYDDYELHADFTFKKLKDSLSPITLNFTITSDIVIKDIQYYEIAGERVNKLQKLFLEQNRNDFEIRFTSELSFNSFSKFMKMQDPIILIESDYLSNNFTATNSTKKKMGKLNEGLIQLME